MPDHRLRSIAENLSSKRYRFLTDVQIGVSAAIMADRIRRHRQAEEQRNSLRVEPVPIEAPIVLKKELKPSLRKREG